MAAQTGDTAATESQHGARLQPQLRPESSSSSSSIAVSTFSGRGTAGSTPPSATPTDDDGRRQSVPSIELNNLSHASTLVDPGSPAECGGSHDLPRSVQSQQPDAIEQGSTQQPVAAGSRNWTVKQFPYANVVASLSLTVASFGLLFFGWRQYRNGVITTWNTFAANCIQAGDEDGHKNVFCKTVMSLYYQGKLNPPYKVWKRGLPPLEGVHLRSSMSFMWNATNATFASLQRHLPRSLQDLYAQNTQPPPPPKGLTTYWILAFAFSWLLVTVATIKIRRMRKDARRCDPPFTSSARADHGTWVTKYEGEEWQENHLVPSDDEILGKLRARINNSLSSESSDTSERRTSNFSWRSLPSSTSSMSSLGGEERKSSTNETKEESYESVIELPTKTKTKVFFHPETGKFIHLSPWKSQGNTKGNEDSKVEKGDTKEALAQMGAGAVTLATGKTIADAIIEALDEGNEDDGKQSTADFMGNVMLGAAIKDSPPKGAGDDGMRQRRATFRGGGD